MLLKKIFSALTVLTLLCALAVGFAAPAAAYTLPEDVRLDVYKRQVFRRETGMTPGTYRHASKNERYFIRENKEETPPM